MSSPFIATRACGCPKLKHLSHRIVLTGGPGAGKTAILEIARRNFCGHVAILPESASIIFSGGFWREESISAKKAAQRAIFHVQRELENLADGEKQYALALCDRGTIDGLAYWPGKKTDFYRDLGVNRSNELKRYAAVIHLRTPTLEKGYNHQNPLRVENALEAQIIDQRIEKAWEGHPRRYFVESNFSFLEKVEETLRILRREIPNCCTLPEKVEV